MQARPRTKAATKRRVRRKEERRLKKKNPNYKTAVRV